MSSWKAPEDLRPGRWFRLDQESSLWLRTGEVDTTHRGEGRLRVTVTEARIAPVDREVDPADWERSAVTAVEFDDANGYCLVWEE